MHFENIKSVIELFNMLYVTHDGTRLKSAADMKVEEWLCTRWCLPVSVALFNVSQGDSGTLLETGAQRAQVMCEGVSAYLHVMVSSHSRLWLLTLLLIRHLTSIYLFRTLDFSPANWPLDHHEMLEKNRLKKWSLFFDIGWFRYLSWDDIPGSDSFCWRRLYQLSLFWRAQSFWKVELNPRQPVFNAVAESLFVLENCHCARN